MQLIIQNLQQAYVYGWHAIAGEVDPPGAIHHSYLAAGR
jgi:hypothetical protein